MIPQAEHAARVERYVESINDAEETEVPLSLCLWKEEKFIRRQILAAPAEVGEFLPGIEIRAIQHLLARRMVERLGADAYLIAAEGMMIDRRTKASSHIISLYYQSMDGPTLHHVYHATYQDRHIRTGEEISDFGGDLRGGLANLFDPPARDVPETLSTLIDMMIDADNQPESDPEDE